MTREKEIELLMMDRCTKSEAEKHLTNGAKVFDDFEENIESYLNEWSIEEEDKDDYRKMVADKIPAKDWSIVEDNGKTYYIMYVL